jgi:hypothetical protein
MGSSYNPGRVAGFLYFAKYAAAGVEIGGVCAMRGERGKTDPGEQVGPPGQRGARLQAASNITPASDSQAIKSNSACRRE